MPTAAPAVLYGWVMVSSKTSGPPKQWLENATARRKAEDMGQASDKFACEFCQPSKSTVIVAEPLEVNAMTAAPRLRPVLKRNSDDGSSTSRDGGKISIPQGGSKVLEKISDELAALNKSILGLEIRRQTLRGQLSKSRRQDDFALKLELKEVETSVKGLKAQHHRLTKKKTELESNLEILRKNSCAKFTVAKT
eukprot:633851-Hanusia_phi.AAC.1